MLARLQHMRTKLFNQAIKKGQLQTTKPGAGFDWARYWWGSLKPSAFQRLIAISNYGLERLKNKQEELSATGKSTIAA